MQPDRREFLRFSLGASALTWFRPTRLLTLAAGGPAQRETVLVVVQLSGGNDGLNCVVPYADDEYYRKRPTIGLPADKLLRINDQVGFHPNLKEFKRLFDDGSLSVLQGVGYPQSSDDHEVSMRNWQTARPGDAACQTGWLGRLVDSVDPPEQPHVPAVFVGETRKPLTLNGAKSVVPSLRTIDQWILDDTAQRDRDASDLNGLAQLAELPSANDENALLRHVQRNSTAAIQSSAKIRAVVEGAEGPGAFLRNLLRGDANRTSQTRLAHALPSRYPEFQLAKTLHTVAQLIRAELGIRIFCVELGGDGFGGFDNHANQIGNHCALLLQLSESLGAFVSDLQQDGLLDRTLLMTFSEFGRTIAENGRRGTDHGAAAPVFLAGGRLKAGLIGEQPKLTEPEKGGLKPQTDFRSLYATVLDNWLGFDSQPCLGEKFAPLDLLRT